MRGFDLQRETENGRPALSGRGRRAPVAAAFLVGGLALAAASSPANAITKTEKTFKGWTVTCVEDDESQRKRCSMQQSLIRSQDRQLVFSWTIRRNQEGELVQAVAVPTGVSIKEGVRLFLGDSDPQTLGYDICGPRVCFAQVPFTEELISAARGSSKASASYVRGNKQLMQVDLDLDGFTAAYDYFIEQLSS
ncbi:MAG: hypothetical protein GY798_17685 [Hyphomicrobiales bacterium]|nr:hypothetical protein [Hyphomicrobiales bacterium]